MESALSQINFHRTEVGSTSFIWKNEEQCRSYSIYRPACGRDATEIPPEEVANAIRKVLTDSVSLPLPDMARACAQLFGFARIGTNIDATIQRGVEEAVKRSYIKVENGRAVMT